MKKIIPLLLLGSIALASCSKDDAGVEQPGGNRGSAPQIIATVEQDNIETRAGVIEDGDYLTGEKFYWTNGDATKVFFKGAGMTWPEEYKIADYAADVAVGTKSNSCTLKVTQSEDIETGAYTAYGFYPTSMWGMKPGYSDFLRVNFPVSQTQTQANSTHLGAYMLMKAQNSITVSDNQPINLSYKHLSAVLRFAVQNSSSNSNLKLANINMKLSSGRAIFATEGKLTDIDVSALTITKSLNVSALNLKLIDDAQFFSSKEGKNQCEGYMAILPTATNAFENSDDLIIELSFTDGTGKYLVTKTYNIGTTLTFLSNGIEQGKSYYFQLKIETGDLVQITGTSYAVGDYWPDSTSPEGIVFWVKPGSLGTKGKVVSLGEKYVDKWGSESDEKAAGVTGIRSLTDGATATKSMIAQYKISPTFSDDYPAFYYIYNTVNSGNENGTWYLPARDELKMLFAGYSGKEYESITSSWTSYTMPGYDSPECAAARSAFNAKLTSKGGNAIYGSGNSVAEWYFSSSEILAGVSYSVSLEEGASSIYQKNLACNIRWIRNF